jgi:chitin disaccharide deacetylase
MTVKDIILCADDFGLTKGVSEAILDLAALGRISATSVMVNRPWWQSHGSALLPLPIGVGLHLTLTLGRPLGDMPSLAPEGIFPSLSDVIIKSVRGGLIFAEIEEEIERQCDAFVAVTGRPPDHIDGHQHVHVLPVIRKALLRVIVRRGWQTKLWLRDPSDGFFAVLRRRAPLKALVVKALAFRFRRATTSCGIVTNRGFSGFSRFRHDASVASIENDFVRHVQRLGTAPLIMCHPGYLDEELVRLDPVIEPRAREVMYLTSGLFEEFREALNFRLVPSLLWTQREQQVQGTIQALFPNPS